MARSYKNVEIELDKLMLDVENPRFASGIRAINPDISSITQEDVINYLVKYHDIIGIAERVVEVEELYGSEPITCYSYGKNM